MVDLWVAAWRKKQARGNVMVVPYADDIVFGFEHRDDAERFQQQLKERLAKFGLELHPDKTRLIAFGRDAERARHDGRGGKPGTFDFLGFTHICGRNRKTGYFTVRRKTTGKRLRAKLKQIRQVLRVRMHDRVEDTGRWLRSVVQGYFNYQAVPENRAALETFRAGVIRHWLRTLRRRSQRQRPTWRPSAATFVAGFPRSAFCTRIRANALPSSIRGGSRMRPFRTYGSERGALGNRRPYRDLPLLFKD